MKIKNLQIKKFFAYLGLGMILMFNLCSVALAVDPVKPPADPNAGTLSENKGLSSSIRDVGTQAGQNVLNPMDAGHSKQNWHSGASQITSVIYYLIDFVKYILGSIAVLMLVVSGVKLVIASKTVAETMNKEKATIGYAASGLIVILVTDQFIKNVFFGEEGEVYSNPTSLQSAAERSNAITAGFGNLLKILIPSLAVLFFVIAGVRLVLSQGQQEAMNKAKTQMTWSIFGLILAGLAELIVTKIIYPNSGTQLSDTQAFAQQVITMTNFISGFMSTVAITMIIYAGYIYSTSLGGEGAAKAKKIVTGAVIGLLIAMAAFALVNTFVKLEPTVPVTVTPKDVVGSPSGG